MNLGLVVRADDRGLGHMTLEAYRHLAPARTLVVREPGAEARGFAPHLDRYPDGLVVTYTDGTLPEATVRDWLAGLDAVYSAETFYDWRMVGWSKEAGVATVLHAMPEFHHGGIPETTAVWAPTPWRLGHLPTHTRLVPVPTPAPPAGWSGYDPHTPGPARWVHVAGHRAAGDRNGTTLLLAAVRYMRAHHVIRVECQDHRLPSTRATRTVQVVNMVGGRTDRWALYADVHGLVLPRRYGGLCLPALEAMAAGLAVVMPDAEPQATTWPVVAVPASMRGTLAMPAGDVPLVHTDPRVLAATLDALAGDRNLLASAQADAATYAAMTGWVALLPLYRAELARAAGMA